jgi:hypothetical protein
MRDLGAIYLLFLVGSIVEVGFINLLLVASGS